MPSAAAPTATPPREKVPISRAFFNGEGRNRTGDTTIFSRVLYQLSYLAPYLTPPDLRRRAPHCPFVGRERRSAVTQRIMLSPDARSRRPRGASVASSRRAAGTRLAAPQPAPGCARPLRGRSTGRATPPSTSPSSVSCCVHDASAAKKKTVSPASSATDMCPRVGTRWTLPAAVSPVLFGKGPKRRARVFDQRPVLRKLVDERSAGEAIVRRRNEAS
jgi:hypothetical protein